MKKISFLTLIILSCCCGCFEMFETQRILIKKYPLKNGENVEFWSVGSGATTVDNIWVFKTRSNQVTKGTVCNLLGLNEIYTIDVKQLDDSIIRIALFDTSKFTYGDTIVKNINLNKKVITYR